MQPTDATYRENNRDLRIRKAPLTCTPRTIEVQIDGGVWTHTYQLDEDRTDADYRRAAEVATAVYGRSKRTDGPACTNSMTHDIWNAMRDIAGC